MLADRFQVVLRILGDLRTPRTVEELASSSGLNVKTIRRELITLQQAGFDLRHDTQAHNRKVWRVVSPLLTIVELMDN